MIHEVVKAIHRERPIIAGRISNHTHIFHDRGPVKMVETDVTLKLKSRVLAGKKTTRSPTVGQLLERVKNTLEKGGFTTGGGENHLHVEKEGQIYNLTFDRKKLESHGYYEVKIKGNWTGGIPAIEKFALERKLRKLVQPPN